MGRYRNYSSSGNNGLIMRLLGYSFTTFIIPFVINMIKNKLSNQQRLLCNKCHGKLDVIDKSNFYCKNCKIIKFDRY
jgi:hypothetical protein